jgi:hypothetical protein
VAAGFGGSVVDEEVDGAESHGGVLIEPIHAPELASSRVVTQGETQRKRLGLLGTYTVQPIPKQCKLPHPLGSPLQHNSQS